MIRYVMKLGMLWLGFCTLASAYETKTHELISRSAVASSVLSKDAAVLENMGLGGVAEQKFGVPSQTIADLVGEGAVAEDDFPRPVNHFFDPTHAGSVDEGAIRAGFLAIGIASPSWALEDRGAVQQQDSSLIDARRLLLTALTSSDNARREADFAGVFRSLGAVIHHLQDMAQPQHVRNDLHCSVLLCQPFLYNPSAFESYTEAKVRNGFTLGGYPSVYTVNSSLLNSPRKFWITGDGKGIAEFTNRNFVSAGTNFRYENEAMLPDSKYQHPVPLPTADMVTVQQAYAETGAPVPPQIQELCADDCWIEFVSSTGVDYLTGQSFTNPRAASLSIFDQYLNSTVQLPWTDGEGFTETQRVFSLNSLNFDKAHEYLLARAVGYSAGLIDYFFRGKVDLIPNPSGQTRYLIKNLGAEPMKGKFSLYYDDQELTRHAVKDASGMPLVWDTEAIFADGLLAPGATMPVPAFAAAQSPAPKTVGEYMLVFAGDMGEEKADAFTEVVGAVVSKKVMVPNPGVLYFIGLDAANQRHYFRLDRNGLSTVAADEVNPLVSPFRPIGSPFALKQSSFDTTPDGDVTHKTAALVLRNVGTDPDFSLVADLTTGALTWKPGIRWLARSPDPAIGSFEFTLNIFNTQGTQAYISYVRRYTADNQVLQTSGNFLLPDLVFGGYTYNNIRFGGLGVGFIVTDNGTMLYPEGGISNGSFGIQITLGAQPSAALFDLPDHISTSHAETPINNSGSTGATCTVDYVVNEPNVGKVTKTATGFWYFSEGYSETESFEEGKAIGGIAFDKPIVSRARRTQHSFRRTRADSCIAAAEDWSGDDPRMKLHVEFRKQTELPIDRDESEVVLGNGLDQFAGGSMQFIEDLVEVASSTITYCGDEANPAVSGPSAVTGSVDFVNANYSYEGFCPTPVQSAPYYRLNSLSPNNMSLPKRQVVRALSHDIEDAIYEEAIPGSPIVRKFKDIVLPTLYAVETSPLGEVLIANHDLTLLEHHPKYGMPMLRRDMLPADIVAVEAWVWL